MGECVRHFATLFLHQLGNCAFWVVLKAIENWAETAILWCYIFRSCLRLLGLGCGLSLLRLVLRCCNAFLQVGRRLLSSNLRLTYKVFRFILL